MSKSTQNVFTKEMLVEAVAGALNISKAEAGRTINVVYNEIEQALHNNQSVKLGNIGTLKPVVSEARTITHPQTGKKVQTSKKGSVKLKASTTIKTSLTNRLK